MKDSRISWTDHTFNPWIGCARVSPGCLHCYAEARNDRYGEGLWGVNAPRRVTSPANWRQPIKWNRDAEAAGVPAFVFCASLADVFEDRDDLIEPRAALFDLVDETPWLTWLMLTKRPQNVNGMVPLEYHETVNLRAVNTDRLVRTLRVGRWPANVWIGTTVEDQQRADERIPHLLAIPATRRFLSCEPLLGPVTLPALALVPTPDPIGCGTNAAPQTIPNGIDWVIVGGESGPNYRPMAADWARGVRDICLSAGVPLWFKQRGGTVYVDGVAGGDELDGGRWHQRPPALVA